MTTHPSELSDEQIDKMILESSVPFVSYGGNYWDVDGLIRKVDMRELARALRQETTSAAAPAEPVAWRALGGEWNVPQDMEYRYGPWNSGLDPLRFQPLYATPITPAAKLATADLIERKLAGEDIGTALKDRIDAYAENYVAWLRFTDHGTLQLCDSDAEGAFKVARVGSGS